MRLMSATQGVNFVSAGAISVAYGAGDVIQITGNVTANTPLAAQPARGGPRWLELATAARVAHPLRRLF